MEDQKVVDEQEHHRKHSTAEKLSAAGWGLFFIWIGISFLAKFDVGVGLLGVGIITLAGQAARKFFNLKMEGFWIIVGVLFVLGGIWNLLKPTVELAPILIIAAGAALILSIFKSKHKVEK
jgi:hypothetical protein